MSERVGEGVRGVWAGISLILAAGLLSTLGCSGEATPGVQPKPIKLAQAKKIAVIRLGDHRHAEPVDPDISAGIQYAGVDARSFVLVGLDAKGDPAAVPGLIDTAIGEGADVLMTLLPETTLDASTKDLKVPLVFQMTSEPIAMGLGKSDSEHRPNLTGAYTSFVDSLIVPIAQGCLPRARKLGIPFNPGDRLSVIHKDAVLRTQWGRLEPVTAEFHSESEVPAAVRALIDRKAEGILLVTGIGEGARAAIAEARKAKVPVFGFLAEHARAGAIVAREPRPRVGGFEAGRRAGRILQGEPAATLTFARVNDYKTYANPAAARDLGVKILGELMRDAKVVTTDSK
ncbi:MAG: ABC transporter substrate binding protein [Isosphaeraceae bacterium]